MNLRLVRQLSGTAFIQYVQTHTHTHKYMYINIFIVVYGYIYNILYIIHVHTIGNKVQ